MNRENPRSIIETAFRNPKARLHRESILIPAEPLHMEKLVQSAVETEEDQEDLDSDGPQAVFEKIGWPYETFMAFYWQSMGPMVWQCYLKTLQFDKDMALICCNQDDYPTLQAVALVKHPSRPAVMSSLFKALIDQNGSAFGVELFCSLPSNTHNMSEKTIPERIVRSAFWNWLLWAEKEVGIDWSSIAEETSERTKSPITYTLELLKKLGESIDEDLEEWFEEQTYQSKRLTVSAKHAIFDAFFKQSYGPY